MSPTSDYSLLLDAIVPLGTCRVDHHGWDATRWGRTLRAADWHRLSPILFCYLEPRPGVPAAVRSALERSYLANAARNLFIAATSRRVFQALADADVPAMPLKGAALIETIYPDPGQREMLDLDILVPANQISDATAALAELGYRAAPGSGEAQQDSMQLQPERHHDLPLVGEQQLVAIELHRHVALVGEGNSFEIDGFWDRARSASDSTRLLPAPEDLLLHVCMHFTRNRLGGSYRRRHTGGALGQICDIARIVDCELLDWEVLAHTARSYGLGATVFLALFAARELGVQVPEAPLAQLRPPGFEPSLGRRLVSLRVLRDGNHMPVRGMRWMFAPSREVLSRGWNADPTATRSLARAYMRRARTNAPLAKSALRRPWAFVQDQRLNDQIRSLQDRA